MMRPTAVEETNSPPMNGSVMIPDLVAETPRLIWKYCARKTVAPKRVMPTSSEAIEDMATVRLRNRRSGMIGSTARCSASRVSASRTTAPPTITAVLTEPQA